MPGEESGNGGNLETWKRIIAAQSARRHICFQVSRFPAFPLCLSPLPLSHFVLDLVWSIDFAGDLEITLCKSTD
jgi:hypothetical protein